MSRRKAGTSTSTSTSDSKTAWKPRVSAKNVERRARRARKGIRERAAVELDELDPLKPGQRSLATTKATKSKSRKSDRKEKPRSSRKVAPDNSSELRFLAVRGSSFGRGRARVSREEEKYPDTRNREVRREYSGSGSAGSNDRMFRFGSASASATPPVRRTRSHPRSKKPATSVANIDAKSTEQALAKLSVGGIKRVFRLVSRYVEERTGSHAKVANPNAQPQDEFGVIFSQEKHLRSADKMAIDKYVRLMISMRHFTLSAFQAISGSGLALKGANAKIAPKFEDVRWQHVHKVKKQIDDLIFKFPKYVDLLKNYYPDDFEKLQRIYNKEDIRNAGDAVHFTSHPDFLDLWKAMPKGSKSKWDGKDVAIFLSDDGESVVHVINYGSDANPDFRVLIVDKYSIVTKEFKHAPKSAIKHAAPHDFLGPKTPSQIGNFQLLTDIGGDKGVAQYLKDNIVKIGQQGVNKSEDTLAMRVGCYSQADGKVKFYRNTGFYYEANKGKFYINRSTAIKGADKTKYHEEIEPRPLYYNLGLTGSDSEIFHYVKENKTPFIEDLGGGKFEIRPAGVTLAKKPAMGFGTPIKPKALNDAQIAAFAQIGAKVSVGNVINEAGVRATYSVEVTKKPAARVIGKTTDVIVVNTDNVSKEITFRHTLYSSQDLAEVVKCLTRYQSMAQNPKKGRSGMKSDGELIIFKNPDGIKRQFTGDAELLRILNTGGAPKNVVDAVNNLFSDSDLGMAARKSFGEFRDVERYATYYNNLAKIATSQGKTVAALMPKGNGAEAKLQRSHDVLFFLTHMHSAACQAKLDNAAIPGKSPASASAACQAAINKSAVTGLGLD